MITTRRRLDPTIFDLPVEKMRAGWYTDAYFNHTRAALLEAGKRPHVVLQVFQNHFLFTLRNLFLFYFLNVLTTRITETITHNQANQSPNRE